MMLRVETTKMILSSVNPSPLSAIFVEVIGASSCASPRRGIASADRRRFCMSPFDEALAD